MKFTFEELKLMKNKDNESVINLVLEKVDKIQELLGRGELIKYEDGDVGIRSHCLKCGQDDIVVRGRTNDEFKSIDFYLVCNYCANIIDEF